MELQKRYQRAVDAFLKRVLEQYRNRVEGIILFGSVARGEAKEDSDIDILVIWRGNESEGWRAMTGLAFDVLLDEGAYISIKVIGGEDLKGENPFIKSVMREGIKIA